MCCYESIVNAVIQKIIKEMHQTAEPAERQWARENILDAVIDDDNKVVTLAVTSEVVKAELSIGQISAPFQLALESAYPDYWLAIEVKEPLNLTAFALDKVAH
jgi:hypothetical protein